MGVGRAVVVGAGAGVVVRNGGVAEEVPGVALVDAGGGFHIKTEAGVKGDGIEGALAGADIEPEGAVVGGGPDEDIGEVGVVELVFAGGVYAAGPAIVILGSSAEVVGELLFVVGLVHVDLFIAFAPPALGEVEDGPLVTDEDALSVDVDEVPIDELVAGLDVVAAPVGVEVHGAVVPGPGYGVGGDGGMDGGVAEVFQGYAGLVCVGHHPAAGENAFGVDRSGLGVERVEGIGAAEEVAEGYPDGLFMIEVGGEDGLAEQFGVGSDLFRVELDDEGLDGGGSGGERELVIAVWGDGFGWSCRGRMEGWGLRVEEPGCGLFKLLARLLVDFGGPGLDPGSVGIGAIIDDVIEGFVVEGDFAALGEGYRQVEIACPGGEACKGGGRLEVVLLVGAGAVAVRPGVSGEEFDEVLVDGGCG